MNDYLLSLILGVIEGLTEFLPVSSTAHLRIAEALLHVNLSDGYWKMYSIVIQLGAILCLPVYFRARIARLLSTFPSGERGDKTSSHASAQPDDDRIRCNGDPVVPFDQSDWKKSREPDGHGLGAAGWRRGDVDRRCDEGSLGESWTGRKWEHD